MKTFPSHVFLFLVFVLLTPWSFAQNSGQLNRYKEFYLGMTETAMQDSLRDKYSITKVDTLKISYFNQLKLDLIESNIDIKKYHLQTKNNIIGENLPFNRIELMFLDQHLFRLYMRYSEETQSPKEVKRVIKDLRSIYQNQIKAEWETRPDKSIPTISGAISFSSEPKINGKLCVNSNSLRYYYKIKHNPKKHYPIYIVMTDESVRHYWDGFNSIKNAFELKGLKAYNNFRNVNLGTSRDKFLSDMGAKAIFVPDSIVADAYAEHKDKDIVLKHVVYVDIDPEDLPGIPLSEVDYYFYHDVLTMIRVAFSPDIDLETVETLLKSVYGKADKQYEDFTSVRQFDYRDDFLNQNVVSFSLTLNKGTGELPSSLIYQNLSVWNELRKTLKAEQKSKLQNAF